MAALPDLAPAKQNRVLPYTPFRHGFGLFGPAIIILAFGQATGELIHWPYLSIKYGAFFLFLLLPACFLQFPTFSFLARHTITTGESFFPALIKTNKLWAVGTFIVFVLTSIWIGSYTAAGGAAIAKMVLRLTGAGWSLERLSTWIAIAVNAFFCYCLLRSRDTYKFMKKVMDYVAVSSFVLIVGLFVYVLATHYAPGFFSGIWQVKLAAPPNWESGDAKILLTAIVFAGLGGLWNILYASWVRSEGLGMARFNNGEFLEYQEEWAEIDSGEESLTNYSKLMRRLHLDLFIGIGANFVMLVMLAYIAFATYPTTAPSPQGLAIVTSLADAFAASGAWLWWILYLLVGVFLIDTWLTAGDSLSKVFSNFLVGAGAGKRAKISPREWYVTILFSLFVMTVVSSFMAQPQQLIYLNGVMSGFGAVVLIGGILFNEVAVRRKFPWLPKHRFGFACLVGSLVVYAVIGTAYVIAVN